MQFRKSTLLVRIPLAALAFTCFQKASAQINSPYSRYGLGDLYNSRNVASKAMGSLVTPYIDYQSVNFINPASYSRLERVTFDVGIEYESRTIKNADKTDSYNSGNLIFNYVAIGMPLMRDKQGRTKWGLAFGLRPYTRMNYGVVETEKLSGLDSTSTYYKGEGGANKAFIGTGFRVKGFSLGANIGYYFGQTDISTQRAFLNDTLAYAQANYQTKTSFNKLFAEAGVQWEIKTGKNSLLRLAANGHLGQKLNASRDRVVETILYNSTGTFDSVDVITREKDVKGKIELPSGYTVGIMFDKMNNLMVGAEWERTNWDNYRYYGEKDQVASTNMFRVGGQYLPDFKSRNFFNRVMYRVGFYTGKDYIVANGKQLPVWGATFGFGLPVGNFNPYSFQYTTINTSFEIGKRGNTDNVINENLFKINVGLCLSDIWFRKRRYE